MWCADSQSYMVTFRLILRSRK